MLENFDFNKLLAKKKKKPEASKRYQEEEEKSKKNVADIFYPEKLSIDSPEERNASSKRIVRKKSNEASQKLRKEDSAASKKSSVSFKKKEVFAFVEGESRKTSSRRQIGRSSSRSESANAQPRREIVTEAPREVPRDVRALSQPKSGGKPNLMPISGIVQPKAPASRSVSNSNQTRAKIMKKLMYRRKSNPPMSNV